MKRQTSTFSFTGKASYPKNAVALLYDLEGFSRFFNQPDVQDYVPAFLNHVSAAMGVNLFGGEAYWAHNATIDPLEIEVAHEKFTGDGALYILLPPAGSAHFPVGTLQHPEKQIRCSSEPGAGDGSRRRGSSQGQVWAVTRFSLRTSDAGHDRQRIHRIQH